MERFKKYIRNKYVITIVLFMVYTLFLDDVDIFSIVRQNAKIKDLKTQKTAVTTQLNETRSTIEKLNYPSGLEKYAREKKLFKRDDEDIFVISVE